VTQACVLLKRERAGGAGSRSRKEVGVDPRSGSSSQKRIQYVSAARVKYFFCRGEGEEGQFGRNPFQEKER